MNDRERRILRDALLSICRDPSASRPWCSTFDVAKGVAIDALRRESMERRRRRARGGR